MKLEKTIKEDRRVKQLTYEYILPDYEGTLKRVMLSDARLLPSDTSYVGDDLVLSGVVCFTMLYLTVDDTLSSLRFEVPYECSFVTQKGVDVAIENVRLASFSCLPSGPRRIVAKAEVVGALRELSYEDLPVLTEEENLMLLKENHAFHTHVYSKKEEREYAEDIFSCEGAEPAVLYSDSNIELLENRPMKDGVTVSGVCHVRCLLSFPGGGERSVCGDIPFDEFIPMGEILPEKTSVLADVTSSAFSMHVQKEGDTCHLIANPTLGFFVTATKEETATVVVDAFSCVQETKLQYESVRRYTELPLLRYKQRLECRLSKDEGDPVAMSNILFAKSEGVLVECTPDDGVIYMLLKLSHSVIGTDFEPSEMSGESEENDALIKQKTYVRQRMESTHALNIPCAYSIKNASCHVSSFCVLSPEIYVEENAFLLVCEVSFVLQLAEEKMLSSVVSCEACGVEYEKERDSYVITYPACGATLWSLAKENHVNISELVSLNPMLKSAEPMLNSSDSLKGIRYLLLP